MYCQVCNISGTLLGSKIVNHSHVVGASPVGAVPTTSSFFHLTLGFNLFHKDSCTPRRETYKFRDLVRLILDILR